MRVLVADDHALMRTALAGSVTMAIPGAMVETVDNYPELWARATAVDLVLSDLMMPGAQPFDGVSRLRVRAPNVPVIIVTGAEDDSLLLSILSLGIAGFVPKSVSGPVLEAAIRLVMAGGQYLPPRLAALALAQGTRSDLGGRATSAPLTPTGSDLTPRQLEVLRAIADGMTTKQIAQALSIATATVKAHTAATLLALDARNRAHAVTIARERGLI